MHVEVHTQAYILAKPEQLYAQYRAIARDVPVLTYQDSGTEPYPVVFVFEDKFYIVEVYHNGRYLFFAACNYDDPDKPSSNELDAVSGMYVAENLPLAVKRGAYYSDLRSALDAVICWNMTHPMQWPIDTTGGPIEPSE